jgi:3-deoxy-D-manno-octulosonic-acid transferase
MFCAKVHLNLKKKFKNLLTIIIPRHIERSMKIKKELENFNLKVHLDLPFARIKKNTDIFLINSYGKTNIFFKKIKIFFLVGL